MPRSVSGMVVAITGASSGIGRALAVALSARGARLVLAARRLALLEELDRALGGGHLCVRADVASEQDCVYLVQAAKARFGRLDTLVCNAGVGLLRPVGDTSAEDWRSLFAVNLYGTADCIRVALPVMRAQQAQNGWRGQLMIVSSCLARRAVPDLGAYCASKAAQLALAEALRVEERPNQIAVTSVHPVGTATEFEAAAESLSGQRFAARSSAEAVQAPATVAEAMVAAIIRPRPEVWPHRASRWAFSLATLMPGLADAAMARFRRRIAPPP
jgi:NADP-dependent 3-hydroxy acid dehydrogenase YdfG